VTADERANKLLTFGAIAVMDEEKKNVRTVPSMVGPDDDDDDEKAQWGKAKRTQEPDAAILFVQ